ncbi:MAG: translocation/assembly module TamB domain-containing protein [Rubricoccaceae bacterium]|nr:translocation/assembly module TamB domain-containing protein [Rubricoccaceae bacterium]
MLHSQPPPKPTTSGNGRKWLGRLLLYGTLSIMALFVLIVLLLQTDWGRERVRRIAEAQIQNSLAENVDFAIGSLEGNVLTRVTLTDISILQESDSVATLDSLQLKYRLLPLLGKRIHLREVGLTGLSVYAKQHEDGSFNLTHLLPPEGDEEEPSENPWTVFVESIAVENARAGVTVNTLDSTFALDHILFRASNITTTDGRLRISVDTLSATATAPNQEARIALATSGELTAEHLNLTTLSVTSNAGTQIRGSARYVFQQSGLPDLNMTLAVEPLELSDVRAFTNLPVYGQPRLQLTSRRDGDNLLITAEATPHEGASISLEGALEGGQELRYQAAGTIRDLNPEALTRDPAHRADLNGEIQMDLAGTSPQTLDGAFSATLTDTRIGGRSIEQFQLDGSFAGGRVDFDLNSAIPGLTLRAEGFARPFDETPTYTLRSSADDVNLALLFRDQSQSAVFSGNLELSGSSVTPESAVADATLEIDRFRTDAFELESARVNGLLRSGSLQFTADAQLARSGGSLSATGSVRPFDAPITYQIEDGRFTALNVAALTNNPEHASDITGTFSGTGRGIDPGNLQLELTTAIRNSYFDRFDLVAVDAVIAMNSGLVNVDGVADLGRSGVIELNGGARPFETIPSFYAQGQLLNVDLAELLDNPRHQSNITSSFFAEGHGASLQDLDVTAHLEFQPSSYGAQEITGGRLDLQLQAGYLTATGDVETPNGALALNFSGNPFDENASLAFFDGTCFTDLNLANLTGNPAYRSRLSGCFSGRLNGLNLAEASGEGTITLRESVLNQATIDEGMIAFRLDNGLLDASASVLLHSPSTPDSQVDLNLNGRLFDDEPTYAASGSFDQLDLTSFTTSQAELPIRLSADFDLDGRGLNFETMRADLRMAGSPSKVGAANLDTLFTQLNLDQGVVRVDTLFLESEILNASAGGQMVLTDRTETQRSDFQLRADIFDVTPLNQYLEQSAALQEGALRVSVMGDPGEPLTVSARIRGKRIAYGTTAVSSFSSSTTGTFDPNTGAFSVLTNVAFDFFSQPGLLVESGNVNVSYDDAGIGIGGNVILDRRRNFAFVSRLELSDEASALHLDSLSMQLDGTTWSLAQPTDISIGEEGYRVQTLLLTANEGNQQIVADGVINPNGEQSFVLSVDGFEIGSISDLIGFEGLGGRLSTDLAMSGPAHNPEIFGRMTVDRFTSLNNPVGEIGMDVNYANDRLDLDALLEHRSGRSLTATGFLPLHFSLADALSADAAGISETDDFNEVQFSVRTDSLPVDWLRPFFNRRAYTHMDGLLNADLVIDGTQAEPLLKGGAELIDGAVGLAVAGRIFETLSGSLRFIGNQAVLDRITLTDPASGRVTAEATGTVTLPKLSIGELDLTVTPHQLMSMETRTYDGLVIDEGSEPIRLSGTLQNPVVRGSAILSSGNINMTDELVARDIEDVQLTQDDLREIQERYQRVITEQDTSVSRFYKALDLNIDVEIGRNVWLRSSSGLPFAVEFTGDIQAVKAPLAEQTSLFGTVEVTRGNIETLNRRFEIQRGTLVFNGLVDETIIDLEATLDIRTDPSVGTTAVEITLLAQGRLADNLTITLTSTPQLDNADIVSLIATGRLAEDLFGGGALLGTAEGLALGTISGIVEDIAGNALGLDVIQIDQEPGGLVIRLGKHLGNKAFVSIGQPIGTTNTSGQATNNPQVTFEYALMRWLLLQLEYENGVGGGLLYEYAY